MKTPPLYSIFIISILSTHINLTEEKKVTIWVPGTIIPLIPKTIRESHFHRNFGLSSIYDYLQNRTLTTNAPFSLVNIAKTLHESSPLIFSLEDYYVFGWSGKPSFAEREYAANILYKDIIKLKDQYIAFYGQVPFIRIISHSHGGNVILNLAPLCKDNHDFYIDEIILLACPVQKKTKTFIKSPCFKKIYAFYSSADIIQTIDPQGLHKDSGDPKDFSSQRKFKGLKNFYQTQVQINEKSLGHIDFISTNFLRHLYNLCNQIEQFYSSTIPEQKNYEQTIDIHVHKDLSVQFLRKLKQ